MKELSKKQIDKINNMSLEESIIQVQKIFLEIGGEKALKIDLIMAQIMKDCWEDKKWLDFH